MTKKKPTKKKTVKAPTKKKLPSLKELKDNLIIEQDKYIRLFAEFENYKRRTAKERLDLYKTAGKEVISSLLPVLDDFKRAMSSESNAQEEDEGLRLIFNKFSETLKNQGLIEIEVKTGDIFDPEIHEAISQIPSTNDDQKGKVIDIIQEGYKLGDSICLLYTSDAADDL